MNNQLMFSSKKSDWETPSDFFNRLNREFHFTIDVCADSENHKCSFFYTKEIDALKQEWNGTCWMNPPYGKTINQWIKKAYESSLQGDAVIVCLIPARTDTKYWHEYCMKASEIRLVKGRIKFVGADHPAPFPSAIIVFKNTLSQQYAHPKLSSMSNK